MMGATARMAWCIRPALSRRGIPLLVAGSANSPSVAEQALFMMLTLAKRAVEMHALVKDGQWSTRLGKLPYDLFGKTVLIVGFGRIGTRTAKRCLAMEMNVLIYDPYKSAVDIKAAGCEPTICSRAIINFMQRSASTTSIAPSCTANATAARAAAAPAA